MLAVFWSIVAILHYLFGLDRYGVELKPYLAVFWRTRRLNRFIDRIAFKYFKFWKVFFTIGAFMAIGELLFTLKFFASNLLASYYGESAQLVLPLIPGVTISFSSLPYFLVAVVVVFCLHEFAHGIAARVEGIRLKSIGIMFVVLIFGGFAELVDEDVSRAKIKSKLRLLAAGSMANLLCGIVFTVFITYFSFVISPFFSGPEGVLIVSVVDGSPADRAGLVVGDVILSINGTRVTSTYSFVRFMYNTPANSTLIVSLLRGDVVVYSSFHPLNSSIAFLGVRSFNYYAPRFLTGFLTPMSAWHIYNVFMWIELLSVSAALINMLPIPFFDGGGFFEALFQFPVFQRRTVYFLNRKMTVGEALLNVIRLTSIMLLFANISQSLVFGGFRLP